ncbi:MAG: uridine kinase [Fuerstiella sp.]
MHLSYSTFPKRLFDFCHSQLPQRPIWVGLAGCPGSGKTTIAQQLVGQRSEQVCVIPMDGYHLRRDVLDSMDDPKAAYARRGAPFTFDAQRFVADLITAKTTGHGSFPTFEHRIADPVEDAITYDSDHTNLVFVEGNYLLLNSEPWSRLKTEVFDLTCWLDVPVMECCARVHQRNLDLGMSEQASLQKIKNNDRLNAELVCQNGSQSADWVITSST